MHIIILKGVKVFDLYLLDDDWALNNANWQWLSCSNFFYQVRHIRIENVNINMFECFSEAYFVSL